MFFFLFNFGVATSCDAVTYSEHARRKTVTAMDVVYVLKRQGRTLYGFRVLLHVSWFAAIFSGITSLFELSVCCYCIVLLHMFEFLEVNISSLCFPLPVCLEVNLVCSSKLTHSVDVYKPIVNELLFNKYVLLFKPFKFNWLKQQEECLVRRQHRREEILANKEARRL